MSYLSLNPALSFAQHGLSHNDVQKIEITFTMEAVLSRLRKHDPNDTTLMLHSLSSATPSLINDLVDAILQNPFLTQVDLDWQCVPACFATLLGRAFVQSGSIRTVHFYLSGETTHSTTTNNNISATSLRLLLRQLKKKARRLFIKLDLSPLTLSLGLCDVLTEISAIHELILYRIDETHPAFDDFLLYCNLDEAVLQQLCLNGMDAPTCARLLHELEDHDGLRHVELVPASRQHDDESSISLPLFLELCQVAVGAYLSSSSRRATVSVDVPTYRAVWKSVHLRATIVELECRHGSLVSEVDLEALDNVLQHHSVQRLVCLPATYNPLDRSRVLESLLRTNNNKTVKSLSFNSALLLGNGNALLTELLHTTNKNVLTDLRICNAVLDCHSFCQGLLASSSSSLVKLELVSVQGVNGVSVAAACFHAKSNLQRLVLQDVGGIGMGNDILEGLASASSRQPCVQHIQELVLTGCGVHASGMKNLARYLKKMAETKLVMERLDVSDNNIGLEGCRELFDTLVVTDNVTELDLRTCTFGVKGLVALADCLPKLRNLRRLLFTYKNDMSAALPALRDAFAFNTSLADIVVDSRAAFLDQPQRKMIDQMVKNQFRNRFLLAASSKNISFRFYPRALGWLASSKEASGMYMLLRPKLEMLLIGVDENVDDVLDTTPSLQRED